MADDATPSVQQLHKQWRSGDAAAGQAMARLFTDWCYAITAVRLGDRQGQEPWRRACDAFAQGIREVTRSGELVDWAHGIVNREVMAGGGRFLGGDLPNSLTSNRSPTELLATVRGQLEPHRVRLLALAYSGEGSMDELVRRADELGGWPFALLDARYTLKRLLRDQAGVAFSVVPDAPNLDRGPLPLYEAGRMASADEESFFEKWLISDMDLCRDVAEFACFTHALRAGALSGAEPAPRIEPGAPAAPSLTPPSVRSPRVGSPSAEASPARTSSAHPSPPASSMALAVVGVLLVLALIVAVLVFFLK